MAVKPKKAAPKTNVQKQLDYIAEHYGFMAGFLQIPEIKRVLLAASNPEKPWSAAKLQGAIYKTGWWKKTAEVTRQWIALQSTDPATAKRTLDSTKSQIRKMASQQGVPVADAQLTAWATNVHKFGWTPDQVQAAVGHQFKYNPQKALSGQSALTVDALKAKAGEYLIPISDATINKWGQQVLAGEVDLAAFESYAKGQAKSRWPGLAEAIDRGVTVEQYTDTYRQTIAQELEIDPDTVNLMDAKWSKVIDSVDPKTGGHVAMSLADTQAYVRKQPEWWRTKGAKEQEAGVASYLAKTFGVLQ